MKRTTYCAAILGHDHTLIERTTTYAMNSAIRTAEVLLRDLARQEGVIYSAEPPVRLGDVYTRRWTGANGRIVYTEACPWSLVEN